MIVEMKAGGCVLDIVNYNILEWSNSGVIFLSELFFWWHVFKFLVNPEF
jgi:hypothetical protein